MSVTKTSTRCIPQRVEAPSTSVDQLTPAARALTKAIDAVKNRKTRDLRAEDQVVFVAPSGQKLVVFYTGRGFQKDQIAAAVRTHLDSLGFKGVQFELTRAVS